MTEGARKTASNCSYPPADVQLGLYKWTALIPFCRVQLATVEVYPEIVVDDLWGANVETEAAAGLKAPDTPEVHLHLSPLLPLPCGLFRQVNAHSLSKSCPNRRSRFIPNLGYMTPRARFTLHARVFPSPNNGTSDENAKRHRSATAGYEDCAYGTGGSARTNAKRKVKLAFQKEINAVEIAVLLTNRI
ncbi:hypothetical protein ALC60_09623 [Trachymyrmex zeteki]|uniref:Uncharacterized protein n=1 Tax=Mycetomoellerius zeteki TaxID=64791 RepID=A0A151WTS2_9HYME|nr:hypothetical protein ALC60_09623 [Trachymyrmex zeteki]